MNTNAQCTPIALVTKGVTIKEVTLFIGVPVLLMALLMVFEPVSLDLWIADHLYIHGVGFIGKKSFFLEDILHDRVKQALYTVPVLALLGLIASYCKFSFIPTWLKSHRREMICILLAMGISTGIMPPLKRATAVQCPWSLDRYGGVEHYSSLMSPRAPAVKNKGLCWPGGHASAGFSFLAFFFLFRDKNATKAKKALIFAITLGSVLGFGRMLQGAHFLSHNVWTMLIDWTICAALYFVMLAPHTARTLALNRQPL
jgi:membrane-associated PAP2 superfamily phosphatase